MNFVLSPADKAFQQEVQVFLAENLTSEMRRGQRLTTSSFTEPAVFTDWQRVLHRRGWVAPAWPKEHGGPGWTPMQRFIFEMECGLAGAPNLIPMGLNMVGPVIMKFGSPAQKALYLPRILSGEDYWCQGYSEPGAGSDLASLSTRAIRDGDDYVVTGTKIWTTHAHHANRMFALVRTADSPRPQDGISFLLLDMKSPGIDVRPIITIGGDHEVNQIFFDGVRVPVANRIGEENKGWTYAKYLLEFERGGSFRAPRLRQQLTHLRALIDGTQGYFVGSSSSGIAARLSMIEIDIDALTVMQLKILADVQSGHNPGSMSSVVKLCVSSIRQAISSVAVDALGQNALIWEEQRPLHDLRHERVLPAELLAIMPAYLDGRANTIAGGTSEIQYDIIAKRILGLS